MREANKAAVCEQEEGERLSAGDILSYGMGGITATMTNQFKLQFHMNFLSDVAHMPIGIVGVWSMILTLWDAVNDPLMGRLADRTNTRRFGKYRPHMMMGSVLLAITIFCMFSVPGLSTGGKLVYYIVFLALFSTFGTQFAVPWQALNSVMSQDSHQRNLLLTSRQLIGAFSASAIGLFTMPVVYSFADRRRGWQVAAAIVCVATVACGLLSARGAKKKDYYNSIPSPKHVKIKGQLALIFKNRALVIASLLLGAVYLGISINSVVSVYYLEHVVKNVGLQPIISLINIVAGFVFVPFLPALLKRFGKLPVLLGGMGFYALAALWLMSLGASATPMQIFVMSALKITGITCANVCCFALIPDCTDYAELHFGSVQPGFISAMSTFVRQFCGSFSTLIVGALLQWVGYSAGTAASPAVVKMILAINTVLPLVLTVLVVILVKLYPITRAYAAEMQQQLRRQRAQR